MMVALSDGLLALAGAAAHAWWLAMCRWLVLALAS
jgi:hypothetical protein